MYPLGGMTLVNANSANAGNWGAEAGNNGRELGRPDSSLSRAKPGLLLHQLLDRHQQQHVQTFATAWYTRLAVMSCPSDGDQQGFRNSDQATATARTSPPGSRHPPRAVARR